MPRVRNWIYISSVPEPFYKKSNRRLPTRLLHQQCGHVEGSVWNAQAPQPPAACRQQQPALRSGSRREKKAMRGGQAST